MRIIPKAWYSWDFDVVGGDRTLATLDLSCWREKADVLIEDVTHRVFREHAMNGDFIIERGGQVLARATKPSAFRHAFLVNYNGKTYSLRRPSVWRRAFALLDGERQIGSVSPNSMWTRDATADLPRDWPMAIKAFVIWLVIILWKRDSDSAAAAG
jgi:hypothetical protein